MAEEAFDPMDIDEPTERDTITFAPMDVDEPTVVDTFAFDPMEIDVSTKMNHCKERCDNSTVAFSVEDTMRHLPEGPYSPRTLCRFPAGRATQELSHAGGNYFTKSSHRGYDKQRSPKPLDRATAATPLKSTCVPRDGTSWLQKSPELVAHPNDPLPPGYRFLRKGNVYLTANCRRLTHTVGKTVYIVQDHHKKQLGIRIPNHIFAGVVSKEQDTREKRVQALERRDNATARKFKTAILKQFPKVPENVVPQIVKHALVKRKKRVARNGTMKVEKKVRLAVQAHVRHCHTDYDQLLRDGVTRNETRSSVSGRTAKVLQTWAGRVAGAEAA